ncbi:MAG: AAA family ATPase [Gallionella sp.]
MFTIHSKARPLKRWITHGLSGSGKTHLTPILLQEPGIIRLRSDVERKRLATPPERVWGGLYSQPASHHTD